MADSRPIDRWLHPQQAHRGAVQRGPAPGRVNPARDRHSIADSAQARSLSSPEQPCPGLREIGRIERTLFTLAWLEDPALRRRVTAGLNKGEARNSLARAVFFNRLGEIRDRSFENQQHRASGLNLVVAAITLWNTVYLERAAALLTKSRAFDSALLQHVSPLGWEHINLTGDYTWRSDKRVAKGGFRQLRNPGTASASP